MKSIRGKAMKKEKGELVQEVDGDRQEEELYMCVRKKK